jgi:hypothetical protein
MDEIFALEFDKNDQPMKRAEHTEAENAACFRKKQIRDVIASLDVWS